MFQPLFPEPIHYFRHSLFLAFVLMIAPAVAGPMTRSVESVMPRIGQRGTTVDIRIQGVSLKDPKQIIFHKPGIRAIDIRPAPKRPARVNLIHGAWIEDEILCRFVIDSDCPPGEHLFRVRTARELSNIGTFHVSPFPVIDEEESTSYANDSLQQAQRVPMNVTVRGLMSEWAKGDRDLYRVACQAGQRLSVEVDSTRIANKHYGDSEFDLALRVLDSEGRVLAANDDNSDHLQDPWVSFKIPADGDIYIEVLRSIFVPGRTNYCVHIGDFVRPTAMYPAGGMAGSKTEVRLLGDPFGVQEEALEVGRNFLTGDPLSRSIPQSRWMQYFGGGPSALRYRMSPYENTLESLTSDVTRVERIPAALNGIIDSSTDRDQWRFAARKDERMRIRVFAASLGSPIDPIIRLRPIDASGRPGPVELERDDSPIHHHDVHGAGFRGGGGLREAIDPSVLWTPAQDGDYLLEIADLSGHGNPSAVYRIEIEYPQRVIHTYLRSRTNDWTESMRVSGMIVPRGNRWTVNVSLTAGQADWPVSEFDLIAHGLPKGLRMLPTRIRPGRNVWPVQFEADADATPTASVITFEARPTDPEEQIVTFCQQNVPFINHSGGNAWRTVRTDRYVVAITDPSPFSIEIEQPKAPLVHGGELAIPVRVIRHGDFNGPVEIRCGFIDGSISIPPPLVVPPGQNSSVLRIGASKNAPEREMPLVVLGDTGREDIHGYLGVGHIRVSSRIVNVKVARPFVEMAAAPESIRRGEEKQFVWTVKHRDKYAGQATVRLLGLPRGVTVLEPLPVISSQDKEAVFLLKATDEALLGQAKNLSCEVTVPFGKQPVVLRTGQGTLRIDPAAVKEN